MDYLNQVNELHPIRRSDEQKAAFRSYVVAEAEKHGRSAELEILDKKHHNLVIGDVDRARVIVTAHYDTPATSVVPNLMLPRNPVLSYLYHFGYPILLALLSILLAVGLKALFEVPDTVMLATYLVFYFGIFFICNRAFTNKHNKNDNTSGVATVLALMERTKSDKLAFILFDNEEKGLLGSKAYYKHHKEQLADKAVINLDCVGVGSHVLLLAKKGAEQLPEYQLLQVSLKSDGAFQVQYFPAKGSVSNSDYKSFPCGIGVMCCHKKKAVGYYTSRIHTNRDTVADSENIAFLADGLAAFAARLE